MTKNLISRIMPQDRNSAIDIARGLAIVGMAAAHMVFITDGWGSVVTGVGHGRSAALFALLAGVSLGILSGRTRTLRGVELLQSRMRIFVRAAVLLAICSLVAMYNTGVVLILTFYAFWFIFAIPFVQLPGKTLLKWAFGAAIVGPPLAFVLTNFITNVMTLPNNPDSVFFDALIGNSTYLGVNAMALIFTGMALTRFGLLSGGEVTRRLARRCVGIGLVLAVVGMGGATAVASIQEGHLSGEVLETNFMITDGSGSWSGSDSASDLSSGTGGDSGSAGGDSADIGAADNPPIPTFPANAGTLAGQEIPEGCYCEDPAESGDTSEFDQGPVTWQEELAIGWREFVGTLRHSFLGAAILTGRPHSGSLLELWGNIGFGLLVVGLLVLAPRWLQRGFMPLAVIGSMSLSAYCFHVFWITTADKLEVQGLESFALCLVAMVVLGTLWKIWRGRGPLEALMHWASWKAARLTAEDLRQALESQQAREAQR